MKRTSLFFVLALALLLVFALAGSALAAVPANGTGADFGLHHADMAQQGMLGKMMNPGMHQGIVGWPMH